MEFHFVVQKITRNAVSDVVFLKSCSARNLGDNRRDASDTSKLSLLSLVSDSFATSGKSAPTDLHPNNNDSREAKVVVGPTGPTGDTGPSGPAGNDGIGLRLKNI